MPLFIDVTLPRANSAELDLLQIARCDGGLGEASVPNDNTAVQVTYEQPTSGVGQDRLKQLVTSGTNIVIHPVDSSFVFGDGTPITSVSGQTFPFDGTAIRVIYDSSWAAGSGYFVFDTALNPISFPTPVMLFHELSHAFHMDVGDIPADGPSAEFQAETDEDAFRAQVGLTARDPTNHDGGVGVGNGQVVPDCSGLNPSGGGGGGTITCFIVSAALGSPRAAAVLELQESRDALADRSRLCGAFIRQIMDEYRAFSPAIAATMMQRPVLAASIGGWLVAPLLRYRELLDLYIAAGGDLAEFVRRARPVLAAVARASAPPPAAVAAACEEFAARLACGNGGRAAVPQVPADAGAPDQVFAYIAAMIAAGGQPKASIAWAAEALALFWSAASDLDGLAKNAGVHRLVDRFEAWLASVPLPAEIADLPASELAGELAMLAQFVFRSPRVRAMVAERLLAQAERPAALAAILREAGYPAAAE